MSWFGGGKKADKGRKKQIASLEARDGKSYKLYKMARNHFRVTFRCKGFSDPLAIQIHLSDDFPESAPKISVDRKYSHHLLDDNGVVTKLPDLSKWSVHSDLGSIVQKITNIFNTSSPTIKQNFPANFQQQQPNANGQWGNQQQARNSMPPSYQDHLSGGQMGDRASSQPMGGQPIYGQQGAHTVHGYPYGYQNQHRSSHSHNNNNHDQSMHSSQSPTQDLSTMKLSPPSIITGFAEKTYTELEEMDKEPKLVEDFAYTVATPLREMKKEAQNGCIQTAQKNIAANEAISELIKKNNEIRSNVETLSELYKNLKKREQIVLQRYSLPNIMNKLDAEMDKIDEQCEVLKDKFQTKDEHTPLVVYVKKLALMRSSYHILAIKKEKLEKLMSGHF